MIRVEFFCDDAKLGRAMHALAGLALGQPIVQPVTNATAQGGKVIAQTNGDKLALFKNWAKQNHLKAVTPAHLREFTVSIGKAEGSYSMILKYLLEHKAVRRVAGAKGNKISYAVTL